MGGVGNAREMSRMEAGKKQTYYDAESSNRIRRCLE